MLLISFQQNAVVCQVVGGRRRQLVAVFFTFLRDLHDARRRVAVCPTTRLTAQSVAAAASVTMVWCQRTTRVQQRCRCVTQCIDNTSASRCLKPHFIVKPSLLPCHSYTHREPFYGPFSGATQVSWCQKRTSELYGAREN